MIQGVRYLGDELKKKIIILHFLIIKQAVFECNCIEVICERDSNVG
jgi:hypothetical protein